MAFSVASTECELYEQKTSGRQATEQTAWRSSGYSCGDPRKIKQISTPATSNETAFGETEGGRKRNRGPRQHINLCLVHRTCKTPRCRVRDSRDLEGPSGAYARHAKMTARLQLHSLKTKHYAVARRTLSKASTPASYNLLSNTVSSSILSWTYM